MNVRQLFSWDELTNEEMQQAIFAIAEYLKLTLVRVPIEKSTIGQTQIEVQGDDE